MRSRAGGKGLANKVIDSLPFALHLPTYKFCGPCTNIKRLINTSGKNPLDEACKQHTIAYNDNKDVTTRNRLADATWTRFKTKGTLLEERTAAWIVTNIMKPTAKIGAGQGRRRATKRKHRRAETTADATIALAKLLRHA